MPKPNVDLVQQIVTQVGLNGVVPSDGLFYFKLGALSDD